MAGASGTLTVSQSGGFSQSRALIVAASAAGTVFEWYDFYIYGLLLAIISRQFFSGLNDTAAYIFALLGFAAAFFARPFGALFFGRIGDLAGRKRAFLITITLMGIATFAVGLLPTYAQIGFLAPTLLISLRLVQGFAVGGEYGGAAIYVAENAPKSARGLHTSWIQSTASIGLVLALLAVLIVREIMGETAFAAWGWRIPFLLSAVLMGLSVWMRMSLAELPLFKQMRDEARLSKAPISEAFGRWSNLKTILIVLFGFQAAHGALWYSYNFYVPVFLGHVLRVDDAIVSRFMLVAIIYSIPAYVFFGWLSDRIGRKRLMLGSIALSAIFYFPLFHLLSQAANPALADAQARAPIVLIADQTQCSVQFDPVGGENFSSSCDIAKAALANAGVSYRNQAGPAGADAQIRFAGMSLSVSDGRNLAADALKSVKAAFNTKLSAALGLSGYPRKADPRQINSVLVIAILLIWMTFAAMLYGPMAAALVELFPTRIRYTALSLPYHLGTGWFGGFLPAIVVAVTATTGNIYDGLWFPVVVSVIALGVGTLFLPETYDRELSA